MCHIAAALNMSQGFVVDEVVLRWAFSEYFGLPCQFLFHQLLHHRASSHPRRYNICIDRVVK
jgi:hypothetical protein